MFIIHYRACLLCMCIMMYSTFDVVLINLVKLGVKRSVDVPILFWEALAVISLATKNMRICHAVHYPKAFQRSAFDLEASE